MSIKTFYYKKEKRKKEKNLIKHIIVHKNDFNISYTAKNSFFWFFIYYLNHTVSIVYHRKCHVCEKKKINNNSYVTEVIQKNIKILTVNNLILVL